MYCCIFYIDENFLGYSYIPFAKLLREEFPIWITVWRLFLSPVKLQLFPLCKKEKKNDLNYWYHESSKNSWVYLRLCHFFQVISVRNTIKATPMRINVKNIIRFNCWNVSGVISQIVHPFGIGSIYLEYKRVVLNSLTEW